MQHFAKTCIFLTCYILEIDTFGSLFWVKDTYPGDGIAIANDHMKQISDSVQYSWLFFIERIYLDIAKYNNFKYVHNIITG